MDEVGDDGKQPYVQGRSMLNCSKSSSGQSEWEIRFTAVIKEECRGFAKSAR